MQVGKKTGGKRQGCSRMNAEEMVFEKSKGAPGRVVEGKALVVMPATATSFVLNETGARAWELADGKRSVKEIIEAICGNLTLQRLRQSAMCCNWLPNWKKKK